MERQRVPGVDGLASAFTAHLIHNADVPAGITHSVQIRFRCAQFSPRDEELETAATQKTQLNTQSTSIGPGHDSWKTGNLLVWELWKKVLHPLMIDEEAENPRTVKSLPADRVLEAPVSGQVHSKAWRKFP